jgi:hypothetical protein
MTSYLPYEPKQARLMPDALQDWLPEGHLAYFISDTVDQLDLSAFHARYAKGGPRNQPFHPAMMVKVLVYSYATVYRRWHPPWRDQSMVDPAAQGATAVHAALQCAAAFVPCCSTD